jgi:hypothetical protein
MDLVQFDEVDALDDEHMIRLGLRNFLQTKEGDKRISNVLDADIYTAINLDPQAGEDTFGVIGADVELNLTDRFSLSSDLEFDIDSGDFNEFNARARYRAEDMSEAAIAYRYLDGERSLITPYLRLFPEETWSYLLYARYDAHFEEWQERSIVVNRRFDCVSMGVGFEMDEDSETTLWLQFWLNAYPMGNGVTEP